MQNEDLRQITPLSGHREEVQGVWDTRAGTAEPFRPTSVSQVSHVPGRPGRTATGIAGSWSFRRRHCGVPSVAHIGLCGTPQRDRGCGRFLMAPTDDSAMSAMRRAFGSSLGSPASDPISGPFLATDRADGWFRAGSTYPVFQQTKCCGPFAHLRHRSSCLLLGVSLTFTSSSHYLAMCGLGDFQDVAFGSWVGRG
jgi:hypothetical protein